jgi:hypothetical protein
MMCRSNSIRDLVDAEDALIELGFIRVKFITFLKHIVRFRCKVKEDYYGIRLDDVVE